jgi:hypothetical protein
MVFRLALRQAEAFAGSVLRLLGLDLCVPDHTSFIADGAYDGELVYQAVAISSLIRLQTR